MRRDESGQAAVEFVAVVPFVLVSALVAWQLVLVGHVAWDAAGAARPRGGRAGGGRCALRGARGCGRRGPRRGGALGPAALTSRRDRGVAGNRRLGAGPRADP